MGSDERAGRPVEPVDSVAWRRVTVFLGTILHFTGDPWVRDREGEDASHAYHLFDPGALVVRDGVVVWAGRLRECPGRRSTTDMWSTTAAV